MIVKVRGRERAWRKSEERAGERERRDREVEGEREGWKERERGRDERILFLIGQLESIFSHISSTIYAIITQSSKSVHQNYIGDLTKPGLESWEIKVTQRTMYIYIYILYHCTDSRSNT